NSRRIPAAGGRGIPEPGFSSSEDHRPILEPLYADVAPFDEGGGLPEERLNSRGAVGPLERNTIGGRGRAAQERPPAAGGLCALIADVLETLAAGRWSDPARLESWETETLYGLLQSTIRDADRALIADAEYRRLFGLEGRETVSAADLWRHLAEAAGPNAR